MAFRQGLCGQSTARFSAECELIVPFYNEMWRTGSLYRSRHLILNQIVLEFHADTTDLHAFSDGIWYTDSVLTGDTLLLKGPYTSSALAIYALDDSTISCLDCKYDSNIVFRKFSSQTPSLTTTFSILS